ncbi:MAG: FAD-binding oxidoreductase [Pseudomonadota bacterium]
MTATEREIWGWGRWPRRRCAVAAPATPAALSRAAAAAGPRGAIPRGLGRSYGDSALNPALTLSTARLNRMIAFDPAAGVLEAEAGVSLGEIIEAFLPRGFFPPVTPGTKFVTLGGAVAADVHGKNHHLAGSFGDHVRWLDLAGPDGATRRAVPGDDLFNATVGGMGLTGAILRIAVRLKPVESGWIRQRTVVAPDLDAAVEAFEANMDATYSVAWIDCLARGAARGRSLVHIGEHARVDELSGPGVRRSRPYETPQKKKKRVPLDAPSWALNRLSVRAFNEAYYRAGSRGPAEQLVDWDGYFYPLDAILEWNRIYGARGFAQYQNAIPLDASRDALAEMLDAIAASGLGSFLAVLKRFGPGSPERPLSFPMEGYTLALDFPLSSAALTLMDRLDEITLAAGGRLYLAKDSRMTQRMFETSYGDGRAAFAKLLAAERSRAGDGAARFASLQSERLGL